MFVMDLQKIEDGKQWLEEVLRLSGLPCAVDADAVKTELEQSCWLVIDHASLSPEQTQSLIGEGGVVLDAIQYLANTILNIGQADDLQTAYTIELGGYRVQRQMELQQMAEAAAQQVRETGEEYEMVALSSAERRQVHTYLKAFEDVETYSRGKEPDRRLVVRLAPEDADGIVEVD